MISEQFIKYVTKDLDSIISEFGGDKRNAFELWALHYIGGLDKDTAFNNTDTLSQGDGGLDGWFYDENNVFQIFQMKFPDDYNSSYDGKAGDELIKFYNKLINKTQSFRNAKLQNVHKNYWEVENPEIKVKLNIVVFSQFSETTKKNIINDVSELVNTPQLEIYDINSLFSMYVDENDLSDLTGEKIPFNILNGEYLQIPSQDEESIDKATVVTLEAKHFASLVNKYYPNIVAKNVRFHLGQSKNKGMVSLLEDEENNYKFWYYNNGLTIICDQWEVEDGQIIIENPQIINGGQTSKSLSQNIEHLNDDVFVLAKVIQLGTDKEKGKNEGLTISATSNTQNKVTQSDLKALCPIQKSIKALFGSLEPKWYYEIKNKEWNVLSPAEKRRYGSRKLNKTDIGQEWRMVNLNPIDAISKKDEMYYDNTIYNTVFQSHRDVIEYLYAHSIVRYFTSLLQENNLIEIQKYDEDMSQSILNRIMTAKKLSVGYLSYILNIAIKKENTPINYNDILTKLDNNSAYFHTALQLIFMSFRMTLEDIDINSSLLNKLRDIEILNTVEKKFNDNYKLAIVIPKGKMFK